MFIGNYTHVREIIERVHRNYGFDEIYEDEVKEWIWDALNFLGRDEFLENKISEIEITSHRGIMPSDISEGQVIGIRDKETLTTLVPSPDIYFVQNAAETDSYSAIVQGISYEGDDEDLEEGDSVELTPNEIAVEITDTSGVTSNDTFSYRIDSGYIFTGMSSGTLQISYKGFPVWDDNTPKIPDDSKIIRLVVTHIAMMIAQRLLFKGKISERLFEKVAQEYSFAAGSARNRLIQPDRNEMENIRRTHLRLLPNPNHFKTGFKDLNLEERLGGK